MKKLIALLMVCGFALSFVACGGGSQNEADSEDSVATESPAMEPAPSEADTADVDTTGVQ
ncbi:MAG: hypothetical protein WD824_07095 [Cyclobacteriaceae bacterium]